MKVHKKIYFEVNSDLHCLEKVLEEFNKVNESWVSKKEFLQCQLALAEGFTNAVRHAHKDLSKQTKITLEITLTEADIQIRIWDYGKPFDLEKFAKNLIHKKDILASGGRGVEILQKISDVLTYSRTEDQRNCLLIIKKLCL